MKNKIIIELWKDLIFLVVIFIGFILPGFLSAEENDEFREEREDMVRHQIEERGITDQKVLRAMREVKRHLFVPESVRKWAYSDMPLPIGHGQTISQPFIVAYMSEVLNLNADDRILEIGTGSGYQTAILAEIVNEVFTIEIIEELADSASKRLKEFGYNNVTVKWGDGYKGWPEYAPFDAIIVTAAPDEVPEDLIKQLKVGGRMVIPVGAFFQELYLIKKTESGVVRKELIPVRFVPMIRSLSFLTHHVMFHFASHR